MLCFSTLLSSSHHVDCQNTFNVLCCNCELVRSDIHLDLRQVVTWALFSYHNFYRTRVWSLGMLVTHWLTDWLTPWRLVNLIDATLACKDANSKLVELVSVADFDDEDRVGTSLLQIWSWGLDIELNFCSDFEHKVWSRFWSSGKIWGWPVFSADPL